MNENDLHSVDFTRSLPPVLQNDETMLALARSIAEQLQATAQQIKKNVIYARIDELDEQILDILAYDLHVDWYDYSYPVEVKRQTIKDSINVHRKLGTKYAVETALGAVYPGNHSKRVVRVRRKAVHVQSHHWSNDGGVSAERQAADFGAGAVL